MSIVPEILLILAIALQLVAAAFALRLVGRTKYSSVWILFIIGFFLLTVLLVLLFLVFAGSAHINRDAIIVVGSVASLCMSVGVMYAHKLFGYIDRLNRRQELYNKRLLTAILRTEEKSRSHFAKELHDGTGPLLSAAKMSLTALAAEPHPGERPEQRRELYDRTLNVIEEAIRSLREISNNMQPQILNDFGLARGVRNFVARIIPGHEVDIDFSTDLHDERFDPDVEVIIYRVVCELINNSLKHSGCRSIGVSLVRSDNALVLDYSDDGCGFDPAAAYDGGMGLSNIASRIDSLNGSLEISSESGGGGMRARARVEI